MNKIHQIFDFKCRTRVRYDMENNPELREKRLEEISI